jgi:hypothetical protein
MYSIKFNTQVFKLAGMFLMVQQYYYVSHIVLIYTVMCLYAITYLVTAKFLFLIFCGVCVLHV